MSKLKELFLLDSDVVFLNHGSFGATPRPVLEIYQKWQRELERQPVRFITRELPQQLADSRQVLGEYLKAASSNLVYVPNVTFGVNVVARSLSLGPGDEVLTTDHEYGACENAWRYLSQRNGFRIIQQPIAIPLASEQEILEQFWQAVTPRTRVIYLSHITSSTAMQFPVKEICARAAESGLISVIDGAHAPGQIDIDLAAIGADFYIGNCHKWLCAPKGSAFLYAHPDRQDLIEPLVVGWGWGDKKEITYGSDFLDYLQWLGTNDLAAYLAVPAAISFLKDHNWSKVRDSCHSLVKEAINRIEKLTALPSLYPNESYYHQMAIAQLPHVDDIRETKNSFYDKYRIEVPFIEWNDRHFIRVCVQGYNSQDDIDKLIGALNEFFDFDQ
jgi:isopenicillin-N epimerase